MTGDEEFQQRRPWLTILSLSLLLVFYLASLGPFIGLYEHGFLTDSISESIVKTVYFPLVLLDENTDFFETPVGECYVWYLELFES